MTTKRSKSPVARKSVKKSPVKTAAKKAPRKPSVKAAPTEAPADPSPELVEYAFRGTTYQLQKDAAGYRFGDLTFKSMSGFGKHLAKLNGTSDAATYRDAGVLTADAGLVVRVGAREFQVTIVRSR